MKFIRKSMKFEISERLIREWCIKVFDFEPGFDIYDPRYCSRIKITHIRQGDVCDTTAMTNMIINRINVHKDTFGNIEFLRIYERGKIYGPIEKDTVGELKYYNNISLFKAIALFNEVFFVNGIKCVFKPSHFSDDPHQNGINVNSKLRSIIANTEDDEESATPTGSTMSLISRANRVFRGYGRVTTR